MYNTSHLNAFSHKVKQRLCPAAVFSLQKCTILEEKLRWTFTRNYCTIDLKNKSFDFLSALFDLDFVIWWFCDSRWMDGFLSERETFSNPSIQFFYHNQQSEICFKYSESSILSNQQSEICNRWWPRFCSVFPLFSISSDLTSIQYFHFFRIFSCFNPVFTIFRIQSRNFHIFHPSILLHFISFQCKKII